MADYEALKDQWSDIEDKDGVRLSWNTFPSSRMVCLHDYVATVRNANRVGRKHRGSLVRRMPQAGISDTDRCSPNRSHVHTAEGD